MSEVQRQLREIRELQRDNPNNPPGSGFKTNQERAARNAKREAARRKKKRRIAHDKPKIIKGRGPGSRKPR